MVLSLGMMVGSAAMQPILAALTGGAFGYSYGYNVRRGYHDFRPSKSDKTRLGIENPNPVVQNTAAGELAAEQRTGLPAGLQMPEDAQASQGIAETAPTMRGNLIIHPTIRTGQALTKSEKNRMSRQEWKHWLRTGKKITIRGSFTRKR
jgi:hypothetical protein